MIKCSYCDLEFENVKLKANHIRWYHKNNIIGNKNLSKSRKKFLLEKRGNLKKFEVKCSKCKKIFFVKEYEKYFPKKEKYFCSSFCAHSFSTFEKRKEINAKISKALTKHKYKITTSICINCKEEFSHKIRDNINNRKFCSRKCAAIGLNIEQIKLKLSLKAKERFKKFPEKHPNRKCAGKKSYWQKILFQELSKQNSNLEYEKKYDCYFMDIVDHKNKINIEYDGEFWHKNRKNNDELRDENLKKLGWKILRISSNELKKGTDITKIIEKCNVLLNMPI